MVTVDYEARLTLVQAAITGLLQGKMASYEIDGQKVTKLDMEMLVNMERELLRIINKATRRGGSFRQAVPR
jgi:hypothetical protein